MKFNTEALNAPEIKIGFEVTEVKNDVSTITTMYVDTNIDWESLRETLWAENAKIKNAYLTASTPVTAAYYGYGSAEAKCNCTACTTAGPIATKLDVDQAWAEAKAAIAETERKLEAAVKYDARTKFPEGEPLPSWLVFAGNTRETFFE